MSKKVKAGLLPLLLVLVDVQVSANECREEDSIKSAQVSQKITLLERLLDDSMPVRRAEQSGDEAALQKLSDARARLAVAKDSLNNGCLSDASKLSSEGLMIATAAFKASKPANARRQEAYEASFQQAQAFLQSLESQPRDLWGMSNEDLVGIERQVERAKSMGDQGSFGNAIRLLTPVNDRLQRRLLEILNEKTLYYEKVFATPEDEYAYLKKQYDGYRLLLQSGQSKASYSAAGRVKTLLDDALKMQAEAERQANEEMWSAAIASMEAALENCEQAVRATGYSY